MNPVNRMKLMVPVFLSEYHSPNAIEDATRNTFIVF